ncbi:efflux RND transporter periplasmic adaptor subunit [Alteromonas sp. 1_MG-2023]|uniref:efflux RND transporter periplasmic adaptor subunit n=1 Tax=Alteromonas sp. 1_MG-2023 TaxID=3062669 RepID=UPI0026E2F8B2|nr:efflux RND transporter periplasmic adaptor subunit [Alteromonas sp. 1_MG-2023]MDO6477087.1 efflux RND transporter periplasmic adaptor subunit [Alteromonas sp. 1_MG-2023]
MKIATTLCVLTSLLTLSACSDTTQNQSSAPRATAVSAITIAAQTFPITRTLQGRVVAQQTAQVRPQVGGVLEQRLFEEGSFVEKGQLLYQIDDSTYRASVNEAKADLVSAKASVESTRLIDDRYQNLLKIEGISQQDADNAHADYLVAQASLAKAQAALDSANVNLAFTRITAPISGRTGISNVTEGALLTQGQDTALTTIRKLDPIYIDMTETSEGVLERRAMMQREGVTSGSSDVIAMLENNTEYDETGSFTMHEVAVDEATGSITLRATFPNPDGILMSGMFIRTKVTIAVDENAILVPQQAVQFDNKGNAFAWVVSGNKAVKRSLTLQEASGNKWLTESGVQAGEKLIVEGIDGLQNGADITVTEVTLNEDGRVAAPKAKNQGGNE